MKTNKNFAQIVHENGADPTTAVSIDDLELGDTVIQFRGKDEFVECGVVDFQEGILMTEAVLDDGVVIEEPDMWDGEGAPHGNDVFLPVE